MPKFTVYQVQEEVIVHKSRFTIEAESEDDAIEVVMNGEIEPSEQGMPVEPGYTMWGWSARPVGAPDDKAWDEAKSDLEARRLE